MVQQGSAGQLQVSVKCQLLKIIIKLREIGKKNPSLEGFWVTQRHWHWE